MRQILTAVLISFIMALVLIQCGGDPLQKGDQAFQQKKYAEAMKYYQEALKAKPNDPNIRARIAKTYFKIGEYYFNTRRVIRAFEAQVKKGLEFAPESPSPEFRKELSNTYLALARAYQQIPPENPIQKENFFKKTLDYLEKAVHTDSTNTDARAALKQFMEKNFQEMLNRGLQAYKKGSSDPLQYLVAEYYLQRALEFNPQNKDARKYLRLTRKKGLNVLDFDQDVPLAITSKLKKGNLLAFYMVLHNNTDQNVPANATNFYLLSSTGKAVQGQSSDQFANPFQSKTLAPDQEAEGVVTFLIKPGQTYQRVEYRLQGKTVGYKNLP